MDGLDSQGGQQPRTHCQRIISKYWHTLTAHHYRYPLVHAGPAASQLSVPTDPHSRSLAPPSAWGLSQVNGLVSTLASSPRQSGASPLRTAEKDIGIQNSGREISRLCCIDRLRWQPKADIAPSVLLPESEHFVATGQVMTMDSAVGTGVEDDGVHDHWR